MRRPTGNIITQGSHLASRAVDYSANPDPNIYAPEAGQIVSYNAAGQCGNNLRLRSPSGLHSFCHLEKPSVSVGQQVSIGQAIGVMGYTGYTIPTGPNGRHLHHWFQRNDGVYVYPPSISEPFGGSTPPPLQGYQRMVGNSSGVNERSEPTTSSAVTREFTQGEVLDFKGFVYGESVSGNNVWFVGKHSSKYFWSGSFTDTATHDLADMNIKTPPATELPEGWATRILENTSGVYQREKPTTQSAIMKDWPYDKVPFTFKGYVLGDTVSGNNIWFAGGYSGGYFWSGAFTDKTTNGLAKLEAEPQAPSNEVYTFVKDLPSVTEIIPAAMGSFEKGNFPAKPLKAVIHDFGTRDRDTIGSTLNHFAAKNEVASHFAVSKGRRVQLVSLADRAYHAGPKGNDFVGIETDPWQDLETIESTKQILRELRDKYGYKLELVEHNQLMSTLCGDDVDLTRYEIDEPPKPTPETPTDYEARISAIERFIEMLKEAWRKIFNKDIGA